MAAAMLIMLQKVLGGDSDMPSSTSCLIFGTLFKQLNTDFYEYRPRRKHLLPAASSANGQVCRIRHTGVYLLQCDLVARLTITQHRSPNRRLIENWWMSL